MLSEKEAAYLKSQRLARFATASPDGQPDVVAVNYEFDGEVFYIGGLRQRKTVKYRNVLKNPRVALVVDDLESVEPWRPRGIRVYGRADVVQRRGFLGPGDYIRVAPEVKWSWGIEGPVFEKGRFNVKRGVRAGGPPSPGFFASAYEGTPPWEIGGPQEVFVALEEAGQIRGSVLDVGCGTGENALFLAGRGHEVWGVDLVPAAVERAKDKARERGLAATFRVADALDLGGLGRIFDAAIDSGLFHVFSDKERPRFARSLAAALRPGGTYYLLCFSEKEPTGWGGPRRVTQQEIHSTFRRGWRVDGIRAARFTTRLPEIRGHAWLASLTRL